VVEYGERAAQQLGMTRIGRAGAAQAGHQLVNLLVIGLDLEGQRIAVEQGPARSSPVSVASVPVTANG
jgi:hypothetical protein